MGSSWGGKKSTSYEPWRSLIFTKENLVATVWQDNKPIPVPSTNSRPYGTVVINKRHGTDTGHVDQLESVFLYNKNMNAVDRNDQIRAKYNVVRFSVKARKYLLWFFVNSCIINAYILYAKTSTKRTKKGAPTWTSD